MIAGLTLLLLFQLAGEVLVSALRLPVPGPVVGMLLLFLALLARGRTPMELARASRGLLDYLALFFVPAGVGIISYATLVLQEWLPITLALVLGTWITIAVTALVMQAASRAAQRVATRRPSS